MTVIIVAVQIFVTYDFASAWLAPLCKNAPEAGTWCRTIGFVGPFADAWANRSLFNARLLASIQFAIATPVFVAALRWFFGQPRERRGAYALLLTAVAIGTIAVPALLLNSVS
ncbi:hypothetical protein [Pseudolabrys sp. Root1462]|uniref:hypothetical protein n=1 Tax=Pseudolabrys sp. Root1462 TaxID=1736466 RepID=UPI0012E376C9|nr:hypothetical protein [Pseudolabrys sp. Root1462]